MSRDESYSLDHVIPAGSYVYSGASSLYMPTIIQALLSADGDKKLQNIYVSGMLIKPLEDLLSYFQSKGGKCVIDKYKEDYTFIWKDSFLDVDFNKKSNAITVSGYVLDDQLMAMVVDLETTFISTVKKNLVFTIIKSGDSFQIKNMGDGSSPLMTDNYLPEVLEDVEFVVKAFSKVPAAGRICILNGEPGTGKTHLIRSILMQLDCVFIIVPSNLIDALDKPELMPLLLDTKNTYEKPIIMIIEDGDTCLVPRKNDNISTITSLLNLSDGILGTIIDIKMIISTNAPIDEMDAAILRPGRLCKNIHVGALPYEQANQVYQRLMKDGSVKLERRKYYTLAEIYDVYNNIDILPSGSKDMSKRVIGFSSVRQDDSRTMNKKIGF